MEKPKLENYIKEIPWTDSQGKERKAAGIDFAAYAVALINYIQELEKKPATPANVSVVIAVWRGVIDHAKVFSNADRAKEYAKQLKGASPNDMDYDVTTTTEEVQ